MIQKWEVVPAPSEKNPSRHKLLIKGEMKDIFLVVKKLGKLCSRPEKTTGDFDFLIYLSKLESDTLSKLKSVESELVKLEEPQQTQAPTQAEIEPFEIPKPKLKVEIERFMDERPQQAASKEPFKSEPSINREFVINPEHAGSKPPEAAPPKEEHKKAEPALPSVAFAPADAGKISAAEVTPVALPPVKEEKKPEPELPHIVFSPTDEVKPAVVIPSVALPPAAKQPEADIPTIVFSPADMVKKPDSAPVDPSKIEFDSKKDSGRVLPPSISARVKKESIAAEQAAKIEVEKAKAEQQVVVQKAKIRAKWSIELPLNPTYSFQTLVAGSHNRFAHAASMAVVENPGMIYNPLLIFGVSGTGKTHFIHSISYGLSSTIGQNNIFVTDGIKLSQGTDLAIKDGTIAVLDETISRVKVLIIDDVHLLMISDGNKPYLSKWLNNFSAQNKQIVLTSVFPPKSLGAIEDHIGFKFTQGWMVDLKLPAAQTYRSILNQLLQGMDVKLSEDELNKIFTEHEVPFGEAIATLVRMKKLEKFVVSQISNCTHAQLLDMLLGSSEKPLAPTLTDSDHALADNFKTAPDAWFNWIIFYPKGMEKDAKYALYRMYEKNLELKLNIGWKQIAFEEYDVEEAYAAPFMIGSLAGERKVNGVIVLGPRSAASNGEKEAVFKQMVMKILDSFLIKGTWIQSDKIKQSFPYVKALMDLI